MNERDYRRWAELMDAETAGEPLDPEDRAFCDEVEREDEAAALEAALVEQLREDHEDPPDEAARSIVASAVAEAMAARATPAKRLATWRRPRRVPGVALAATGVAAAAAIAVMAMSSPPDAASGARPPVLRAELVYASGDVRIGGTPHAAGTGVLQPPVVVETGEGRACLVIDPGIDLCTGESTRLEVSELSQTERRVELLAGRVSASLEPQPPGSHFSIRAAGVVSTAVGTAFSVSHGDDGAIETLVTEGQVAVSADGNEPRMVRAHERALSGRTVRIEGVARMDEARARAALEVARLWREGLPATLEVHGPEELAVALDGEPVGHTPLVTLAPAGVHEIAALVDGAVAVPQRVRLEPGGRVRVDLDAADGAPTAAEPPPVTAVVTEREAGAQQRDPSLDALLRQARSQMLDHRWAAAARSYQTLRRRHRTDPEAHAVLVSLGELQLTHLGKPAAALRAFDSYLRVGGPLAQEAAHGRIRALRALQRPDAEARAIERFLEEHPGSPHHDALTRRATQLAGSSR